MSGPGWMQRLKILGPGMLVAASGVGAGDLATGAFTGVELGTAILWAVVVGAVLKFVLNEGIARWQLATGDTLLEGAFAHLGRPVRYVFLLYLLPWSFLVAAALMSACGVTAFAVFRNFFPEALDPVSGKIVFGVVHSGVAVVLVRRGGYPLFEKVMGVCIGVMFATVIATAVAVGPAWGEVLSGLFLPSIPKFGAGGLQWTVALLGGVGGTLTILCYGYWIREEGREGTGNLSVCRLDLASGYVMTALFGMAMVIIGSQVTVEGTGATLIVNLAEQLRATLGPVGMWAFLVGAWGAVFSSLLGVWQAAPYLFSDSWDLPRSGEAAEQDRRRAVDTSSLAYRGYLYALATIPTIGLMYGFRELQKAYAILGAFSIPLIALVLLLLNGRGDRIGRQNRNSPAVTVLLAAMLLFFLLIGGFEIRKALF